MPHGAPSGAACELRHERVFRRGRFNARAISVALTGRNLHTWTKVPNIDPEFSYTIGNFQGVEFGALPNTRSWGLSFRVTP